MVFWIIHNVSIINDFSHLVKLLLNNVRTTEFSTSGEEPPFVLSPELFLFLIVECHHHWFFFLLQCLIHSFHHDRIDKTSFLNLLSSTNVQNQMKKLTVSELKTMIEPMITTINDRDVVDDLKLNVLLPLLLTSCGEDSCNKEVPLLEDELLPEILKRLEEEQVKRLSRIESQIDTVDQIVPVNNYATVEVDYNYFKETYSNNPKLKTFKCSDTNTLITFPKEHPYIASLFYSWMTGVGNPLEHFFDKPKGHFLNFLYWPSVWQFSACYGLLEFYEYCCYHVLSNYSPSICTSVHSCIYYYKTDSAHSNYQFAESIVQKALERNSPDTTLINVMRAIANNASKYTAKSLWNQKCLSLCFDLIPCRELLNNILSGNEEALMDQCFKAALRYGETREFPQEVISDLFFDYQKIESNNS
ncbi:hypothetical protein GEMRC1_011136 [Eukaryota sp. GEM-RC1]